MGYNRSGVRRTQKMKRRKRLETRVAEKAAAQAGGGQEGHGKAAPKPAR